MKMDSRTIICALDTALRERYPVSAYCLKGYQEEAVCLQYENKGWIVFYGERGNRYNEIYCDTILKACLEFIRKLTHCIDDISIIEMDFMGNLMNKDCDNLNLLTN